MFIYAAATLVLLALFVVRGWNRFIRDDGADPRSLLPELYAATVRCLAGLAGLWLDSRCEFPEMVSCRSFHWNSCRCQLVGLAKASWRRLWLHLRWALWRHLSRLLCDSSKCRHRFVLVSGGPDITGAGLGTRLSRLLNGGALWHFIRFCHRIMARAALADGAPRNNPLGRDCNFRRRCFVGNMARHRGACYSVGI